MDRPADDIQVAQSEGPGAVAEAARIISRAGLVEGFGHVSARSEGGFMISPTRPLGNTSGADVISLGPDGKPAGEVDDVPLEAAMHASIYAARPDVKAICRTHSPAAVLAGARGEVPPLVHGLGGLAGEVACCDRFDLVTDGEAGAQVATALGAASALLLRGNGSLSVGAGLGEAVVRAFYLEERCLVGAKANPDRSLEEGELAARSRWFAAESRRAWAWMQWRYGGDI